MAASLEIHTSLVSLVSLEMRVEIYILLEVLKTQKDIIMLQNGMVQLGVN
jgi:hypothetical protein